MVSVTSALFMQSDVRSTYQTRCDYRLPCHGRGGGGSQASDDDGMECECDWCGRTTVYVQSVTPLRSAWPTTSSSGWQPHILTRLQTALPVNPGQLRLSFCQCVCRAARARHMLAHAQTARTAVREMRGREKSDTLSGKWNSLLT